MSGEPKHEHFVWAGCPHATRDEVHFPCKDCVWQSNASAPAAPAAVKKKRKVKR